MFEEKTEITNESSTEKAIAIWNVLHGKETIAVFQKYLPIISFILFLRHCDEKNIALTVYKCTQTS